MRRMMDGPLVSVHSDWVETGPAEMEERVKYTCLKYRTTRNFFKNKYLFFFPVKTCLVLATVRRKYTGIGIYEGEDSICHVLVSLRHTTRAHHFVSIRTLET